MTLPRMLAQSYQWKARRALLDYLLGFKFRKESGSCAPCPTNGPLIADPHLTTATALVRCLQEVASQKLTFHNLCANLGPKRIKSRVTRIQKLRPGLHRMDTQCWGVPSRISVIRPDCFSSLSWVKMRTEPHFQTKGQQSKSQITHNDHNVTKFQEISNRI